MTPPQPRRSSSIPTNSSTNNPAIIRSRKAAPTGKTHHGNTPQFKHQCRHRAIFVPNCTSIRKNRSHQCPPSQCGDSPQHPHRCIHATPPNSRSPRDPLTPENQARFPRAQQWLDNRHAHPPDAPRCPQPQIPKRTPKRAQKQGFQSSFCPERPRNS